MTRTCPACGHDNRETAKFCEECGASLKQIRNSNFEIRNLGSPRAYTPRHLAEDPHLAHRPRRRAQAGDGGVRRREGLEGAG